MSKDRKVIFALNAAPCTLTGIIPKIGEAFITHDCTEANLDGIDTFIKAQQGVPTMVIAGGGASV